MADSSIAVLPVPDDFPELKGLHHGASVSNLAGYVAFYGLAELGVHRMHVIHSRCGEQIVVQRFGPADAPASVFICHGYYDHVGIYGHLIRFWVERGYAVVCFDQVGHGLSGGRRAHIEDFSTYLDVIEDVWEFAEADLALGETVHWVGQSMGGALTMEYLHRHPGGVRGEVVLFAPLVRPYAWWLNRWIFALAKLMIEERSRTVTNNADNPEFIDLARSDPLQPRVLPVAWVAAMVDWFKQFEGYPASALQPLIIQGQADRTVDWRHNGRVLEQRYPEARWLWLPEARHHLVNESATLRNRMWDWLDEHLQPAVGGGERT